MLLLPTLGAPIIAALTPDLTSSPLLSAHTHHQHCMVTGDCPVNYVMITFERQMTPAWVTRVIQLGKLPSTT